MLHDDGQFYGSTRYPKTVSTLSHNPEQLRMSTRYTTENSHGLHDIKVDILKLTYHHPRRFLWAFRTRGYVSRTGLMVYSKKSRYLLLNRQIDKKIGWISASFPLSASQSLLSVKILLDRSNCAKRIGKS